MNYIPSNADVHVEHLEEGLVLFLHPGILLDHAALFSCPEVYRVRGEHPFVCVRLGEGWGIWVPLFSRPGTHRHELPRDTRRGQPRWATRRSFYHPRQSWRTSHASVVEAAAFAGESASPTAWKSVSASGLSLMRATCHLPWAEGSKGESKP